MCLITSLPPDGATLRDMEIDLIRLTIAQCEGNKSLASRQLGISRKTRYAKIKRYGLDG